MVLRSGRVQHLRLLVVMAATGATATRGWTIPTATDIAFAVAVLAVVGRGLPPAVLMFLLTLAVVDDLIAVTIIAAVYTAGIELLPLALAPVPLTAFAGLTRRGVSAWWVCWCRSRLGTALTWSPARRRSRCSTPALVEPRR